MLLWDFFAGLTVLLHIQVMSVFFLSDIIHKMNFLLFTFSLFSRRGWVAERGMDMTAEYGLDLWIYQIDQGKRFFFFIF